MHLPLVSLFVLLLSSIFVSAQSSTPASPSPEATPAQSQTGSASGSASAPAATPPPPIVTTSFSTLVSLSGTGRQSIITTVPVVITIQQSAPAAPSQQPTSSKSVSLPLAPTNAPGSGGGAPSPGAPGAGGVNGPPDSYVAGASSRWKTGATTFIIGLVIIVVAQLAQMV
ncbi:hypothetical protein BOTBODRAFT_29476 [Botryobasidium botryosum FD-172 SS1]|uniref:REJ domain-containing protein n=1 Tax=Botryobasidium botryosum (strain FD-172 SS1) TaxID=930990 RepID=A0A067N2Y2_BOTB1|nr:hypothetical protein BOTBODRAFT_29476 [Botryobasidium botryosum FD-172 SS1]